MDANTLGNLLLYGPLLGAGAYHFGKKGLDMDEQIFGPANLRLVRSTPDINTFTNSDKTGSETNIRFKKFREKTAAGLHDWNALIPHILLATTVGDALGGAARGVSGVAKPTADVLGYKLYKMLFPNMQGMTAFTQAPEKALEAASQTMGKELGTSAASGMTNIISGLMGHNDQIMNASPRRKVIIEQLKKEDSIISKMPENTLLEAYHSMISVAPTLSVDKNAVRSFLRTVAVSPEGGVDWNTMKGLADAESSIIKAKGK